MSTQKQKELGAYICDHHKDMTPDEIKSYMEQGADVNVDVQTFHILIELVRQKNAPLVKLLSRYPQTNLNAEDTHGMTPLIHCIYEDQKEIFDVLIANENTDVNKTTVRGQTALFMAIVLKRYDMAMTLMEDKRSDFTIRDYHGRNICDYIEKYGQKKVKKLTVCFRSALQQHQKRMLKKIEKTSRPLPRKTAQFKKK